MTKQTEIVHALADTAGHRIMVVQQKSYLARSCGRRRSFKPICKSKTVGLVDELHKNDQLENDTANKNEFSIAINR